MIRWTCNSSWVDGNDVIDLEAAGQEIRLKVGCGPLGMGDIMLCNVQGDLVGRFDVSQSIEKQLRDFQPPAVYSNSSRPGGARCPWFPWERGFMLSKQSRALPDMVQPGDELGGLNVSLIHENLISHRVVPRNFYYS